MAKIKLPRTDNERAIDCFVTPNLQIFDGFHRRQQEVFVNVQMYGEERIERCIGEEYVAPVLRHPVTHQQSK